MLKTINKFLVTFTIFAAIYAPENNVNPKVEQLKNAIKQSSPQKVQQILATSKAATAPNYGSIGSIEQTLEQEAISAAESWAEQEVSQAVNGSSSTANMSRGQKAIIGLVSFAIGVFKLVSDIETGAYSSKDGSNFIQNDFTNALATGGLFYYGVRDLYQAYTNTDGTQKTNNAIATKAVLSQSLNAHKTVEMQEEHV